MNYLISSQSYNLINEEIVKIVKDIKSVEYIDFNNSSIDDIVTLASYTSLFNDEKIIVVKNSDFFTSKSSIKTEILEKYLNDSNPNTTLIFTTYERIDERKKITKTIKELGKLVNIKPLNYKEITQRIIDIFKKNKYKISYDDASYICEYALNNYDIALQEVKKIMLYYNEPTNIKREDLIMLVSKNLDDNTFRFVDNVINNNYKEAINILNSFKIQKVEPIMLLSMLAREYRLMLYTKVLYDKKYSNYEISKELSIQDWQVEKYLRNSFNYKAKQLEDKLLELCELDYSFKTSKIDKYLGLEMYILKG